MISYTVVWDPDLESDFIRKWIEADSALSRASNWIDRNLTFNPDRHGRASVVEPTHRSVLVPETGDYEIVVHFRVLEQDHQVEVLSFRHASKK